MRIGRRTLACLGLFAALLLVPAAAFAQEDGSITGTVTDQTTGDTLPGANVFLAEEDVGTSTDADGNYTLSGVAPGEYTIVASFVGYQQSETPVQVTEGEEATVDIELESSGVQLEDVVVTALGFREDRREIGTATSNVSGAAVAQSGENSVLKGLSAKAPGLNVTSTGGDPGAGARVVIRGQTTIQGDNQPLFVIDGVPVSNESLTGEDEAATAGVQQQSRLNDLNPEDIESIEVLKGASAAALWGSRAASGVIVITTKGSLGASGGQTRLSASYKSSVSVDEVNQTVPLQTRFGQGNGGVYGYGVNRAWGDRVSERAGGENLQVTEAGQYFSGVDAEGNPAGDLYRGYGTSASGERYYVIPSAGDVDASGDALGTHGGARSTETFDHSEEVFGTGLGFDNSLSVNGGDENSAYYLSLGHLQQDGIIEQNSEYNRTSLRLNAERRLSDKFEVGANVNYVRSNSDRIQQGSNISGIFLGGLRTPPDYGNNLYELNYFDPETQLITEGRHRSYQNPIGAAQNPGFDNPFWTINNNTNTSLVNRMVGKVNAGYDPLDWLNLTARVGMDYYTDRRQIFFPVFNATQPAGQAEEEELSEYRVNADLIGRGEYLFSDNFAITGLVGFNFTHEEFDNIFSGIQDFVVEGRLRDLENSSAQNRSTITGQNFRRTLGAYSEVQFDLYNQLFLRATGRIDNASTFGVEANSAFFYPSVQAAWEFTQLPALQNDVLNFGKLRANYAQVGTEPDPYLGRTYFFPASFTSSFGPALSAANYAGGFNRGFRLGNPSIQPERKKEFEIGLDLGFFNDRLTFNSTYYNNNSEDLIFNVALAPSTGYTTQTANAAELSNEGVELGLDATWIQRGDFSWNTYANWATNENTVESLSGTNSEFLAGFTGTSSRLVPGEPFGALWGVDFQREEDGSLILNESGFPVPEQTESVIGDPNPDWKAGIGNRLRYKGVSFEFLVDIRQGGDVWNGTRGALYNYGTHEDTGQLTTVSADRAGELMTIATGDDGEYLSLAELYEEGGSYIRQDGDGSYTFRGQVGNFGGDDVALEENWYDGRGGGFGPVSSQFIEDGSYVRLREVTLSYLLSADRFSQLTGLRSAEFAITGRNLLLFTDYSGIDPETNLTGPSNGQGLDYFQNPNTRSYVFTLRLNY